MSWTWRKKKEDIFCKIYFVQRKLFYHLCFISMYRVLNTLSEYSYFDISKNITSYTFRLFLESSKAFSVSLSKKKNARQILTAENFEITKIVDIYNHRHRCS